MIDGAAELELRCAMCGARFRISIKEIQRQPRVECGCCGSPIDASAAANSLRDLDEKLRGFEKLQASVTIEFKS